MVSSLVHTAVCSLVSLVGTLSAFFQSSGEGEEASSLPECQRSHAIRLSDSNLSYLSFVESSCFARSSAILYRGRDLMRVQVSLWCEGAGEGVGRGGFWR